MPDTPEKPSTDETIVCRITPWFYRRMGLLAALFLGMGFYFFYDGQWGYRKDNQIAEEKRRFEGEYLKSFDNAKAAGRLDEWIAQAKSRGMPVGESGEPPKWPGYAAQHGWPENPKHHSEEEIAQQFWWAGAMAVFGVFALLKILLDRNKTFVGLPDSMVMPNGAEVRFADVFKVDKRKWDVKALATVFYRVNGAEKTAVVDDLKYDGAGRVMDRLLAQFSGELIEKVPEEEAPAENGENPPQNPA